jgi:hypothetical protein
VYFTRRFSQSHPGLDLDSIFVARVIPDLIRDPFFAFRPFFEVDANRAPRYGYLPPETRFKATAQAALSTGFTGLTLSMARSGADVLSAHGLRRKVPASRLGTVGASNSDDFEIKEQNCTNSTGFAV